MYICMFVHLQLDSAWIGYNKALGWESTSNWAGFLMAMGLQGYLSQLTADRIYSITDKVCAVTLVLYICMTEADYFYMYEM